MITAVASLESVSPYSQSRPYQTAKPRDESHDDFENRIWKERCHADADGNIFIPPMAFKNCIAEAAKYKALKIPGKGKSTYTKHFEAGVMVIEPLPLDLTLETIQCERLFLPSDGRRGSGSRVWKNYPIIHKWAGDVTFLVFDEIIDEDVFLTHLTDAGQFIGIGRFRPRNNGYYGRFKVNDLKWSK